MKTLYLFGDSNTYGYDPTDFFGARYKEEDIWTFRLREALKESWIIIADGQNGREIPSTSYEEAALFRRMEKHQPIDLFAVMLGTNDYLNMMKPDVHQVGEKMKRFLVDLTEVISSDRILVMSPPPIRIPEMRIDTSNGELSDVYRKVAEEIECRFVDTVPWSLKLAHDGVHLSEEGHHILAERMERIVRQG